VVVGEVDWWRGRFLVADESQIRYRGEKAEADPQEYCA
jgi:hypothetical protein